MYIYIYVCPLFYNFFDCAGSLFSSWGERELLFTGVRGLLAAVAALVAGHRLWAPGLQWLWCTGLVALRLVGSSWTRDQARVPCIDRRILDRVLQH